MSNTNLNNGTNGQFNGAGGSGGAGNIQIDVFGNPVYPSLGGGTVQIGGAGGGGGWPSMIPGGSIDPYGSYIPGYPALPNAAWPTHIFQGDCTACGDKGVQITYTYQGPSITRRICKKCHTKALDKMFGVPINSELESVLYDKKEEQK